MSELTYESFEAYGVEESANRYGLRNELLHGPIPNAGKVIAATEIIFRFPRQLPTVTDLGLLSRAGFTSTGTGRNRGREFTGPRQRYEPVSAR